MDTDDLNQDLTSSLEPQELQETISTMTDAANALQNTAYDINKDGLSMDAIRSIKNQTVSISELNSSGKLNGLEFDSKNVLSFEKHIDSFSLILKNLDPNNLQPSLEANKEGFRDFALEFSQTIRDMAKEIEPKITPKATVVDLGVMRTVQEVSGKVADGIKGIVDQKLDPNQPVDSNQLLDSLKGTEGFNALATVMTGVQNKLENLESKNVPVPNELVSKSEAVQLLDSLKLQGEQLKAFSKLLTHLQSQQAQNVWEYLAGKPSPHPKLRNIIRNLAETIRQAQTDLEQPSPSVTTALPMGQGLQATVDIHNKITEGLPTRYDTTELSEKLFQAGATLSSFEHVMSEKGLDLEKLSPRLVALQQKVADNKDIYPELDNGLKTAAKGINNSGLLANILNNNTKELNDYFLLGRKGVDGAQGLGRLQGEDNHKALVVLAQRLNEDNILDKLARSQDKDTALQMDDFAKYEDLCDDLCKLGFGAAKGGGIFGHAIDRGKVEKLITELRPFTDIADKIADYKPATFSQDEQKLLDALSTAGITGETQLNALQQNIQEYAAYKARIASLPQELENSITTLRAKRDAAIDNFSQGLADETKRSFLEKVAQSEMIQQELTPDKTKPKFDVMTVNGQEVKLKAEASERLKEAFDEFKQLGHLTEKDQGIYLWGTNAFLPRLDGEQPLQAAVGDTVATNNAKFITALGEVLPEIPDSSVNLNDYYKTLEEHIKASQSQKDYEVAATDAHRNYFNAVTSLLSDGFIGQLRDQLTKDDPNLMALIKLQRASVA